MASNLASALKATSFRPQSGQKLASFLFRCSPQLVLLGPLRGRFLVECIRLRRFAALRQFSSLADPAPESDLSDTRHLRDCQKNHKLDKWGWVIYRTTYADEEAWRSFKDIINERSRKAIAESEVPELVDSLEWTFVEDPTLDGSSAAQLRARFRAWAVESAGPENTHAGADIGHLFETPRYSYFIEADAEALRTVVGSDPRDRLDAG
jgi:hypothetical protein